MKKELIEYINNLEDKYFLILYPQNIGNYNIVAFLLSIPTISGKMVNVISNNSASINKFLAAGLPNEIYINYESITSKTLLDNQLIIIDDIEECFRYKILEYLENKKVKVICITKGNVNIERYTFNHLKLSLSDDAPVLHHEVKQFSNYQDILNTFMEDKIQLIYEDPKKIEPLSIIGYDDLIITLDLASTNTNNIETVHMVDIKLESYLNILNVLYKKHNLKVNKFTIIFYLNDKNNEEFNKIVEYNKSHVNIYSKLYTMSKSIKYESDIGLFIEVV